jgi:hypothetical protein
VRDCEVDNCTRYAELKFDGKGRCSLTQCTTQARKKCVNGHCHNHCKQKCNGKC